MKKFFIPVGLALVVVLIGGVVWATTQAFVMARDGQIQIESGQSAQAVWQQLVAQEFTPSVWPWRMAAWRSGAATNIQAGTYQLSRGETITQVIKRLQTGDTIPDEFAITYPEGFTLRQMAERTQTQGIGTTEQFLAAASPALYQGRYSYLTALAPDRTLEGYLFPDTYRIQKDDTPPDIIRRLLENFDTKFNAHLKAGLGSSGRSLDQVVIMASVIEREVLTDEDMALVAGVLWKRLDEGLGLDADATIRYALNKWDEPLTVQDLQIDSPYNTRRYRGLPPGPISNPGLRALQAAVYPQASDYYYYLSTPEGKTIFSRTNDEHNINKAKYLN